MNMEDVRGRGNPVGESPTPCALVQIGKSSLGQHREVLSEGDAEIERTVDEPADRNEK